MDILADDQTFEEMGSQDVEVRGPICQGGRLSFLGIQGGRCGVAVLIRCGLPRFGLTVLIGTVLNSKTTTSQKCAAVSRRARI